MTEKTRLSGIAKLNYALAAVGKDMVYMLSATYILYYFQDILGVSAIAMGTILLAARFFDAFNDPVMGIIVAKTKTRWGKFRPWLLIGALTNAVILFYPFMRKVLKLSNTRIFYVGLSAAMAGYAVLLGLTFTEMGNVFVLFIPAFFIFSSVGIINVLTTIFLANTVDYGYMKLRRSDESVVFSMQTFVVKLASGLSAFAASICLQINNLSDAASTEAEQTVDLSQSVAQNSKIGLRMTMTVIPVIGLLIAFFWFRKKFILTDEKVEEISEQVRQIKENTGVKNNDPQT